MLFLGDNEIYSMIFFPVIIVWWIKLCIQQTDILQQKVRSASLLTEWILTQPLGISTIRGFTTGLCARVDRYPQS